MRRIDFVISNTTHHVAMFEPVIRSLVGQADLRIGVISLCEFRGLVTPVDFVNDVRVEVQRIVPFRFRRPSTGGQSESVGSKQSRQAVRKLTWLMLLNRRIQRWMQSSPDLVVIPNDAAFPYNKIAEILHDQQVPFVLVQEGIRFPLPLSEGDDYGRNGAAAIAAWGKSSEEFFLNQGASSNQIYKTGSPRFDAVWDANWQNEATSIKKEFGLGENVLLLLTNPIDDQGFCSTEEKLSLVKGFLNEVKALFEDPEFSLIIKLHGRESLKDYHVARDTSAHAERIHVIQTGTLYPLFAIARASVVFASTVGLESLMMGCPLGVVEIPGHGFVHDYVRSGAAIGLKLDGETAARIKLLCTPDHNRIRRMKDYVERNVSCRGQSTGEVVRLLLNQLEPFKVPA